jgi:hypothetical protein
VSLFDEEALRRLIRAIAREEAARPEHVTQRTVLAVVGLPAIDFLEDARAGAFPSWKVRRLVFAKTVDVVAYLKSHPTKPRDVAAGNGKDAEAAIFAKYGARRVAGNRT